MSTDRPIEAQSGRQVADSSGPLKLEGRLLTVARTTWVIIALASVSLFIAGVPLGYQQLLVPCPVDGCAYRQLSPVAMLALQNAGISPAIYAAFNVGIVVLLAIVYVGIGLLIFWRQSRELVALLGSLWLITFGVTLFEGEVRAVGASYPWLQPLVLFLIFLAGILLLALFLFIFPDGRFVPRWTRWAFLAITGVFLIFGNLEFFLPGVYANFEPNGENLWAAMVLSGIGAQLYRYLRVSGPIERQQTKWVIFGLLVTALGIGALLVLDLVGLPISQPGLEAVADSIIEITVVTFVFMMIPVTIGFSILRYRLWDSDIIINRTIVYGLLTPVLALLYFGSVVLFQQVMQALTGQRSPLAIVASTLLIAALFSPLRRRLQNLIDRRFYRRKYDAAQTLADFAQVAQNEVDLDHLAAELLAVVQQTMQPERMSIWLKEQERRQSQG